MNENIPTSEVLNRAADLIEERGWMAGPRGMEVEGGHCVQGAIQAVVGARTWTAGGGVRKYLYLDSAPCAAGDAVRDYLRVSTNEGIWQWNDDAGRTASQVIEVLRATAVIEAARENDRAEVTA